MQLLRSNALVLSPSSCVLAALLALLAAPTALAQQAPSRTGHDDQRALHERAQAASHRQASAAAITVNTADDEHNADGDCSLREALQATNTNAAVDGCPAGVTEGDHIRPGRRHLRSGKR